MGFSPIQLQLPKLPTPNLSSLGNVAKSLPKPEALQVKGFSTKDTFEAAPQRAAAKPQPEAAKATQIGTAQIGNAQKAEIGNSAKGGNNSQIGTANAEIGNSAKGGNNSQIGTANAEIGNATGGAEAGGAAPAGGDLASQLQAIVQKLQELIGQLTQLLQGGGGGGGEAAKAVGGAGGKGGAGGAGGGEMAAAGLQADDPRLQDALQRIGQDPEGAKLVQAAEAQGLKVQVGNLPPGVMGQHENGVITISPEALKNDSDLIHTMAHELGHAATRDDGDSIAEEKAVDDLGQRIQQRVAPGGTYQLDVGAYHGLSQDNGIRNSLAQIGIN